MTKFSLIIGTMFLLSYYLPEEESQKILDFPFEETVDLFNLDSIAEMIDKSYDEVGLLPMEANKTQYCTWLKKYKNLVNSKIKNSPNYDNRNYTIVGFTKFSEEEYFVEYEGCCELVNKKEIPARAKKQIERTRGCVIPNENKFQPKSYSNSIAKTHPGSQGVPSLIQVWFNI